MPEVVILGAARTPIGSFRSQLSSVPAVQLGALAVQAALTRANVKPSDVQEIFMGQVCQANVGQNPAKQVALRAGLNTSTITTTVNKVCASGLKAIMLAAQTLQLSQQQIAIGGGMENMSQTPFYLPRGEIPYGGSKIIDSVLSDGLTDAYDHIHMGLCAEKTAEEMNITREDQDKYAILSYEKSSAAWQVSLS
ncbi:unnamed protein product [Gongylonema pulchrum]|uniref:Thiolase N-terminal domain-containing protein n=1 Tax=Gongylonema pulchrum TaxID=637853 RepID=A0A3P7Q1L3_9BILA|nr:unnamed protein product [Gongylonema pulchrum]